MKLSLNYSCLEIYIAKRHNKQSIEQQE